MSNEITHLSLSDIARHLDAKELSSRDVTDAFLDRLDELQRTVRPMTHLFHIRAREQADAADARRRRGETRSPLDGVPLTIKESIDIRGVESTMGIPSRKGKTSHEDAVVVRLLREAGTVFLGKTNVSQALLYHESDNPLFGRTENPHHPDRVPGGSSGGEAAAIAAHGSPGGFGTDIGGSIRIPAHFCGICGLKPTVDRISNRGLATAIPGQEVVRGQIGPMARRATDLELLLKVTSPQACAAHDARVPPLAIGDAADIPAEKIRVGVFTDDHIVTPSTAVKRATEEAAHILEDAGCEVVPFDPPCTEELIFTYYAALSADGAETLLTSVPPDELEPALKMLLTMVRLPDTARKIAGLGLSVVGERLLGRMLEVLGKKSVRELWALTKRAREIQTNVFSHWEHHRLDAVICPPHATPALTHGASKDFSIGGALAFRYNLLNFPAGVVPVTRVRESEAQRNKTPQAPHRRAAQVDMGSTGLPVGVQVVARPYREDVVLRLMQLIEKRCSIDAVTDL